MPLPSQDARVTYVAGVAIYHRPAEDLGWATLKECWMADNRVETGGPFATREEAEQFARARWRWHG